MQELERYFNLSSGAGSSRVMDGNSHYLKMMKDEIARFHGAETGLIVGSGFDVNLVIFAAILRSDDAIVYDEMIHASTHDGMQQSQAMTRISFRHSDVDSFRDTMMSVYDSQPLIRQEKRCVIVAIESFYSMDGDICPLRKLIDTAKEIFSRDNAQFLIEEAHSTGVINSNGAGLVCELDLERQVAIRLHTFEKALSASEDIYSYYLQAMLDQAPFDVNLITAIILSNKIIKSALINFARSVIYTTASAFSLVAAARAGYNLMKTGQTKAVSSSFLPISNHASPSASLVFQYLTFRPRLKKTFNT